MNQDDLELAEEITRGNGVEWVIEEGFYADYNIQDERLAYLVAIAADRLEQFRIACLELRSYTRDLLEEEE